MPSLSAPVLRLGAEIPPEMRNALETAMRRPLETLLRPMVDAVNKTWVLGDTAQLTTLSKVVVPDPWTSITVPSVDGWTTFSGSFNSPAYRVHVNGQVETRGYVKSGTIGASGTAGRIWAIPSALQPALTHVFATASNSAFGEVHAESNAAGGYLRAAVGSATSFSIDGCRWFPATPAPYVASCWPLKFRCALGKRPASVFLGEAREFSTNANIYATQVDWDYSSVNGFVTIRNVPGLLPNTYNLTFIVLGG